MHRPLFPRPVRRHRAFTLIELLVSMTVLALLVLLVSQLFSSATTVTVGNRERLDADGQARVVFDHLALDLGKMLKRTDVDYLFAKIEGDSGGGNDKFFFYSEAPAYYDLAGSSQLGQRSSVALVGYRINNQTYQLERLGKQLTWDGIASASPSPGGIMFLCPSPPPSSSPQPTPDPNTTDLGSTLAGNWPNTIGAVTDTPPYTPAITDPDFQVLADRVCRLEFCFQLKNGTYWPIPVCPLNNLALLPNNVTPVSFYSSTSGPTAQSDVNQKFAVGSRWYDTTLGRGYVCVDNTAGAAVWNFLGMQDVRAVVVALAILDGTSARLVPSTAQTINGQNLQVPTLGPLIAALADANPADATSPGNASADPTVPNFAPASGTPVRMMAEAWGNALKQPGFAAKCNVPQRVAAQLRIYQRNFVLNNQ